MNPSTSDRSWNDPPVVKYEISGPTKKHHLLKKRVVEDELKLQASSAGRTIELSDPESKNLTSESISPVTSENISKISESLEEKSDTTLLSNGEESLAFVINTLQAVLDEYTDECEKSTKDVNKRIDIMKESWNSKLSKKVKEKMFELAQELEKGNYDAALKIQWSLMMENVREVKSWMVAVKHIIEMKKERTALDKLQSIDSSS